MAICLILCLATGCSTLRPIQPPKEVPVGAGTAAQFKVGSIGATRPVVGINLYALQDYSAAQTLTMGKRMLSYIKNNLHATAVDIVWRFYAPGDFADTTISDSTTLSAADAGILAQLATQEHLLVEFRPLLFINTSLPWEGHLTPSDPDAWFANYYAVNLPYLRVAEKYHVNEYVVGTEMNGINADRQWVGFLADCAKVYHGQLTFALHQSKYFPPYTHIPPTDLTGVDMYMPLQLPATASLSQVVTAYESFFAQMPAALLRRTAIQETGIAASAGAYAKPNDLRLSSQPDETIQYNWFTAACETVKKFHLRGVFFWKVDLSDFPVTHPATSLSTFEGRAGAAAISKCESIVNG